MEPLLAALSQDKAIQDYIQQLHAGSSLVIEELWNAPKAYLAALAAQITGKHVLLITGETPEEERLFHDFGVFTSLPVVDFPAWETLPGEETPPSPDIVGERYRILQRVRENKQPHILLTGLQACLQKLIPPKTFEALYLILQVGQEIGFDTVRDYLEEMRYTRSPIASDKGEYAIRGGIIDVFPVSSPDPFRIEFWGDTIESIRIFDPIGQKSIRSVEEIEIVPGQEYELLGRETALATLFDYLGPNTLILLDDLLALEDRYALLKGLPGINSPLFLSIESLLDAIEPFQKMFWTKQPLEELSQVHVKKGENPYSQMVKSYPVQFSFFGRSYEMRRWKMPFLPIHDTLLSDLPDEQTPTGDEVFRSLGKLSTKPFLLWIFCEGDWEETHIRNRAEREQISFPESTVFIRGYLSAGFSLLESDLVLFPMTEVTKRHKIRRQKLRSTYHTPPSELFELIFGDAVVHLSHGIGIYRGMERKPNHEGQERDFLTIEYAGKAKLYVPLNQAYLVSKYIGSTEEVPQLHTLGSGRWKRAKELTERAIMVYAAELLKLYAERSMQKGFSFAPDGRDLIDFEHSFPFEETEDQKQAILDTKADMQSDKMMDRLICGDVGYGKTEVAMRAAFKAVLDGQKQVAVLVPTTVLAMQHYENFLERMQEFPLNIQVLSRYRTPKQVRETLAAVTAGSVDILIGTHRILSEDVQFHNLGLIIIDEEQRFGVKAKEKLKHRKKDVDCLALSATPIPRTLYMSLVGARDMSVINTPPQDRLPIKTIVAESRKEVVESALLRELARDGQVYFIHNRVETIYEKADWVKKMVPHAQIVVGHGQMHAEELDTVFHAFKQGKADILVATTIVENGIDIPNANTIFVDRADQFGMADLYQLRGRVGRRNRRAYAYFLVPNLVRLPEIPRRRLQALAEASGGYGGGMKVAMRDLEIRGAGNILGHEQSGHVSAIGFHLYCKLLKRMIRTLQGEISATITDTRLEIPVDAYLSSEYVPEVSIQMEIYQRLGDTVTWEEVEEIREEMVDRFGPLPVSAEWLMGLTRLKVYCSRHGVTLLKKESVSLLIEKKKGKEMVSRKCLFPKYKTPEEMERVLIGTIETV